MSAHKEKILKRKRKHARIRAKVHGTAKRPRLAVFVSNRYSYAQLIDDDGMNTIFQVTSREVKKGTMLEKAKEVGNLIAKGAKDKKINEVVFDRGGFLYSGKVKAIAEGAREGGLKF